jgi:hypothetical protein
MQPSEKDWHAVALLLQAMCYMPRIPIRPVFPGTVPFFIQMSRVNYKSPAFSKYPSVFSLINAIWTDKKNRLKIETVKALIILKTYFKDSSCAEFYDQILNEK